MRWSLALVLAVAMMPAAPVAAQADPPRAALLIEDAADDVLAGEEGGVGVPVPHPAADLRRLSIREMPMEFILELTPSRLPDPLPVAPPAPPPADNYPTFTIEFTAGGIPHTVWVTVEMSSSGTPVVRSTMVRGARQDAALGGSGTEEITAPAVIMDARSGSYKVHIQKDKLVHDALPMHRGTLLADWFVRGFAANPFGWAYWVGDQMGPAASPFELQFGIEPAPVEVSSPRPFHVSNGVASAYTYEVDLRASDGRDHEVQLAVTGAPAGWEFVLPQATFELAAGTTRSAVLLAVVPFAHAHGTIDQFRLQAVEEGAAVGGLQLGLLYTEVPQPSGHHDTLVVHSRAGGTIGYLNTLETDPFDEGLPVPETTEPTEFEGRCYQWSLALEPSLAMGIDLDLARTGSMLLTFSSDLGVFGDGLNGTLVVQPSAGAAVTIADFQGSMDSFRQEPLTTFTLNATVHPRPEGDFVAAGPGSALVLSFTIGGTTYCITEPSPPKLHTGGIVQLPLRDFHVPVSQALEASSGWRITGPDTLGVVPGHPAALTLDAVNLGPRDRQLEVSVLAGLDTDDTNPVVFGVPGGASRPIQLVFTAPALTLGETRELLVVLESDGLVAGFQRVQLVADDATSTPAVPAPSAGTPAQSTFLLAIALLAVAALRRSAPPRQ